MKRDFIQTYRNSVERTLKMYETSKAISCTDLLSKDARRNPETRAILTDIASTQGCYGNVCECCPYNSADHAKRALVALDEVIKIQKLMGTE